MCCIEASLVAAWAWHRRRRLTTLRLHFHNLFWRLFRPALVHEVDQSLWLDWWTCPGRILSWPESGSTSFPAVDAGKRPDHSRQNTKLPPDHIDRPTPLNLHYGPLWPLWVFWSSWYLVLGGQTSQLTCGAGRTTPRLAEGDEKKNLAAPVCFSE